jgi:hypothetical protein
MDGRLTHIAIQEEIDGKVVNWMKRVDDASHQSRARVTMKDTPV